jgi:hypothetical protein
VPAAVSPINVPKQTLTKNTDKVTSIPILKSEYRMFMSPDTEARFDFIQIGAANIRIISCQNRLRKP